MIYTITLNPSIDFYVELDEFKKGKINSVKQTDFFPGGKGINISIILKYLKTESICLGFTGGPYGNMVIDSLNKIGVDNSFSNIKDNTRQNIKIRSVEESDLNSKGPFISNIELNNFILKLDMIKKTDYVIISGSAPKFEKIDFFEMILEKLKKNGPRIFIDLSGEVLKKSI